MEVALESGLKRWVGLKNVNIWKQAFLAGGTARAKRRSGNLEH